MGQAALGTLAGRAGCRGTRQRKVDAMTRKLLFVVLLATSSAAVTEPAAAFLKDAVHGNYSEVTLGRMIQIRGASAPVRQFGAMLVRDHGKGLAQAQQIAARLHLRIPTMLTPEARTEQSRLRSLGGGAFDREVRRYMIDDHQKDIAEFRAQARSGDRATSGYAAATVPVMQRHLAAAEAIRG
jgi:putative membrane protein